MSIYIVICEDRHCDVEATPFTDPNEAIDYAKRQAAYCSRHGEETWDESLTDMMKMSGCIYNCVYSCEGDSVRVVHTKMRGRS